MDVKSSTKIRKGGKKSIEVPLPSDQQIASLCALIQSNMEHEQAKRKYVPVKHILTLLGTGAVLAMAMISPGGAAVGKLVLDEKRRKEYEQWKQYNPYYLRRAIERLQKQKFVEIIEKDGETVVILANNGKRRILKYALDRLTIDKQKSWDGKWRLVIYDVDERRKVLRDVFRGTLQSLGFLKLQESVWLYPYPCEKQISFLREYYDVGAEVIYVIALKIEDDAPYRDYFGLG